MFELTKQRIYVKIGDTELNSFLATILLKKKTDKKGILKDGRQVENINDKWIYTPQ